MPSGLEILLYMFLSVCQFTIECKFILRVTTDPTFPKHRGGAGERCSVAESTLVVLVCRETQIWFTVPTCGLQPFITPWAPSTHMLHIHTCRLNTHLLKVKKNRGKVVLGKLEGWEWGDGVDQYKQWKRNLKNRARHWNGKCSHYRNLLVGILGGLASFP